MLFLSCAGAFWYGVNLIIDDRDAEDKEYTPAILMIVSAYHLDTHVPNLVNFTRCRLSLALSLELII